MTLIHTELTGGVLAQTIEDNIIALFGQMAESLGGEIEYGENFGRHHCFPTNPMYKGVWRSRLTADNADAAIAETVEWYKSRNAPFFFWWTDANTTPDDLGHRLLAHGFNSWELDELDPALPSTAQGAPAMMADMREFDDGLVTRVPEGFSISEVQTDADLLAFKFVFQESYDIPEWAAQAWVDASRHVGIGRTPWRIYVGWLDGDPVALNIVVEGGGIASVWGVATVPKARGKGIGAAITVGPLLKSREAGYRYAGLFASDLGMPVYERIGFKHTGTRINRYLWRNTE